jgi:hypothetical protein
MTEKIEPELAAARNFADPDPWWWMPLVAVLCFTVFIFLPMYFVVLPAGRAEQRESTACTSRGLTPVRPVGRYHLVCVTPATIPAPAPERP